MKYISGYRNGKKTIRVLLEVTDKDLDMFDELAHCVVTEDKKEHPLEKKYQDLIDKTEKCLWEYVDYNAPKFEKYIGYEPIHNKEVYWVPRDRMEKLLTKRALKQFDAFMMGATCVEEGFYDWDVMAFLKGEERFD